MGEETRGVALTPPFRRTVLGLSLLCLVALTTGLLVAGLIAGCAASSRSPGQNPPATPASPGVGAPSSGASQKQAAAVPPNSALIVASGKTIQERFLVPAGFERVSAESTSFGQYLRRLPLKAHGAEVKYFDGSVKTNRGVYEAVVDIDVGTRDLQQCADACMRLRAEYLFGRGRYDEIHFNFASGFRADYPKWAEGYRVVVVGNVAHWVKSAQPSRSYADFRKYMDVVFSYANTVSLAEEMKSVGTGDMAIGDVFVDKGHALMVVDMAQSATGNKKLFMIAQSYMPAQDIQVLSNPGSPDISPWYELDFGETLRTPEWTFTSGDLHRFR